MKRHAYRRKEKHCCLISGLCFFLVISSNAWKIRGNIFQSLETVDYYEYAR
jgi:hypothetical protein